MTDQEAAEFYYARRAEPDSAAEQVELDTPKRLSRVISVRFDPDEAAVIEQHARDAGLTMSAYVRQAALGRSVHGLDLASMEHLVMQIVQETHLPKLLRAVADDVAHIRGKIGA
jgi:hypothetical protein